MFKRIRFSLLMLAVVTLFLVMAPLNVRGEDDPYLEEQSELLHQQIVQEFPSFSIPPTEFYQRVNGLKEYRILEITPRYYQESGVEVSDLYGPIQDIKALINSPFENYLLGNLKRFTVDTMTVKEFNSSREDIVGKYDAIVFSAGIYSHFDACMIDPVKNEGERVVIHHPGKGNDKILYDGYMKDGKYHGEGTLYHNNGKKIVYEGTFKEGEYHGYGVEYYNDGTIKYRGYWKEGKRHCYGESFRPNGSLEYRGYWEEGRMVDNSNWLYQLFLELLKLLFGDVPDYQPSPYDLDNDLTELKANEIIDGFIHRGLPVFIHESALKDPNSILYQTFNDLVGNGQVFKLDYKLTDQNNNLGKKTVANIMLITELMSLRPFVKIYEQPIQYLEQPSFSYDVNDPLSFDMNLMNKALAELEFYVDINQNNVIEPQEMMDSVQLHRGNNFVQFNVPNVLPGLLKYQLVVRSDGHEQKIDGHIRVGGARQSLKVLNLVSEAIYFLRPNGLFGQSSYQMEDYSLDIFTCSPFLSDLHLFCHIGDYDQYDVIIIEPNLFEFSLSNSFHTKLLEQINKGKPVIFTHNVTRAKPDWFNHYKDYLGLSSRLTSFPPVNVVDRLEIINATSYISYPNNLTLEPFVIPGALPIAINEQYQIDIGQTEVVPLLNLYDSAFTTFDRFDSANNYYYYKRNNVVYLAVGQYALGYTPREIDLIGNAIVNSYIEYAGRDRVIEERLVVRPTNPYEQVIVDYKDPIRFEVEIWKNRSKDEDVTVELLINDENVMTRQAATNETLTFDLTGRLPTPQINAVQAINVKVIAKDKQGRSDTYSFELFVANVDEYLRLNQTVDLEDNIAKNGIPFAIDYSLEILSIDVHHLMGRDLPKTIYVNDLIYEAVLPNGVYVDPNKNKDFTIEKLADGTTKVMRSLGMQAFTLTSDYVYVPNKALHSNVITIVPRDSGLVVIDDVKITIHGIGNDVNVQTYDPLILHVDRFYFVEPVVPNYILFPGQTLYFPEYSITGEGFTVVFSSNDENVATVDGEGQITAVAPGQTNIVATLYDAYGLPTEYQLQLSVIVSNYLSDQSGFTDAYDIEYEGETYFRLIAKRKYVLDDLVIIRPEQHVYGIEMAFYLTKGDELINGEALPHEWTFDQEHTGDVLWVVIRQVNHEGEVIREVVDKVKLFISTDHPDDRH